MKDEVKQVSKDEANAIIEKRKPLGLFYLIDGNVYVGIDNRLGNAWVEEFLTIEDCLDWLNGDEAD